MLRSPGQMLSLKRRRVRYLYLNGGNDNDTDNRHLYNREPFSRVKPSRLTEVVHEVRTTASPLLERFDQLPQARSCRHSGR